MGAMLWGRAAVGDAVSVEQLLDSGAEVNWCDEKGFTPLMRAASVGHSEVVTLLVERGADTLAVDGEEGLSALMLAAMPRDLLSIGGLLRGAADPNQASLQGSTALWFATVAGGLDAAALLVDRGGQVMTPRRDGWTPLAAAVALADLKLTKYLVSVYTYRCCCKTAAPPPCRQPSMRILCPVGSSFEPKTPRPRARTGKTTCSLLLR
uniref:Uncharacterized protein n=1 Tax=Rhizochromulina marina TaxID=1034831 RepID=A0A6U1D921_9STRA